MIAPAKYHKKIQSVTPFYSGGGRKSKPWYIHPNSVRLVCALSIVLYRGHQAVPTPMFADVVAGSILDIEVALRASIGDKYMM